MRLLGFMDVKYFKSLLNISTFQTGPEKQSFSKLCLFHLLVSVRISFTGVVLAEDLVPGADFSRWGVCFQNVR